MEENQKTKRNRKGEKHKGGWQTTFILTARDFETIKSLCRDWDEPTMCGVIRRLVQMGGLIAEHQKQGYQLQLTNGTKTVVLAIPKPPPHPSSR